MNEVEVASVYYSNSGNLIVPIVTFIPVSYTHLDVYKRQIIKNIR